MNRALIMTGVALGLAACQPVARGGEQAAPSFGDPVPTTYDWHFAANGGSADLDFGDAAEGDSLFHLDCLADGRRVNVSWQGAGEAVLTSGTATDTFRRGETFSVGNAVFTALRDGNPLAVGLDDADLTLVAKDAGKAEIEAFFAYCTTPPAPPPQPALPPPDTVPSSEGDDQADDLSGVEPIEPGVDVVEGDGAAHEPVDR